MWLLQQSLSEICGLPHVSLQPRPDRTAAGRPAPHPRLPRGSRREQDQGPHAGHGPRHQPRDGDHGRIRGREARLHEKGGIDLDDLRAKADDDTACLMSPTPHTGLFDENIEEIASIATRPAAPSTTTAPTSPRSWAARGPETWARHRPRQPAQVLLAAPRRRRPRRRPIAASERIEPYLPRPQVVAESRRTGRAHLRPRPRPAKVDRATARLPGQLRCLRSLLRVHPEPRR